MNTIQRNQMQLSVFQVRNIRHSSLSVKLSNFIGTLSRLPMLLNTATDHNIITWLLAAVCVYISQEWMAGTMRACENLPTTCYLTFMNHVSSIHCKYSHHCIQLMTLADPGGSGHGFQMSHKIFCSAKKNRFQHKLANSSGCANAKKSFQLQGIFECE